MMTKDQVIGALIFVVCVLLLIGYVAGLVYPPWVINALRSISGGRWSPTWTEVQFWFIAVPVAIAFCVVMAIGAWIGWVMATSPPPKPIEELEAELKKAEAGEEEKKEEAAEAAAEEAKEQGETS